MGNLNQFTSTAGTVFDFNSDGLDRRAVKKSSGTVQWRYIYEDQYRVAAQLTSSSTIQKEFVYTTRVNVPDYMINSSGIKFRIITDHLGSPRLVVKVTDGTVMQRMDYSTLGEVTNDTSANFQPFGFAGGIYDGSAQFVRFGSRDYDPRAGGRWTTKDSIRFEGGDTNLYGYALNDPINLTDPNGTLPPAVWTGGAAALVGLFSGYLNSSSCTVGGRALDALIGAGTGFAGGFLAGVGAGTGGFISGLLTLVGGTAAGAGPALIDLNGPTGDQLLGNSCKPRPPSCK